MSKILQKREGVSSALSEMQFLVVVSLLQIYFERVDFIQEQQD